MVDYADDLRDKKIHISICPSLGNNLHRHKFMELAYVVKGEAEHYLDNTQERIKEGDYFVIDYQSKHFYRAITQEFEVINCLFLPELIDPSLIHCNSFPALISSYQIHFKNVFFTIRPASSIYHDEQGKVRSLLVSILEEFEGEEPGYLQMIRSRIIEILIITMRKIYYAPKLEKTGDDMDQIINYINTQYMNSITLKEICSRFGYSFSYLSMKFKKEFGLSYIEYLQKVRVEQSMRLLAYTDDTIDEIALAVGYKDIKSFYTVFKRIANVTPAQFRKTYYDAQW
ncbi:MAG: helix-turn-helix domain-containing protein [Firmicutes bacterium]|nr:helix-turn-helix domain-containing protein [Bacillota bacterium]